MTDTHEKTSAGGVVVREGGGLEVCLIRPTGRSVWGLPKGGVEPGEDLEQTAVREVAEETGLKAVVEQKIGAIDYTFFSRDRGGRIHKTVHYFLMRFAGGDTADHDHEVSEARWLPVDEALQRMTYPNEREMVRLAAQALARPAAPDAG